MSETSEAVGKIVAAVRLGPDPDNFCRLCGVACILPANLAPTALCHGCCQSSIEVLASVLGPGTSAVPTLLLARLMRTLMGVCLAAKGQADSQQVVADAANVVDVWEEAARRGQSPDFDTLNRTLEEAMAAARQASSAPPPPLPSIVQPSRRIWRPEGQ